MPLSEAETLSVENFALEDFVNCCVTGSRTALPCVVLRKAL